MDALRILFVDENPEEIKHLVLTLEALGNPWKIEIMTSPVLALHAMQKNRYDVVISEIRMNEMSGAEFLRHVHKSYPSTVRIILSSDDSDDAVLHSVGYAHQSLAKPCAPGELWTAMTRSLKLRNALGNELVQRQVSQIRSLPTLPQAYHDLIEELQADDPSIKSVADIIQRDVGMTAKLLQILNSAFFGLPTRINNSLQAVSLLGLDKINALAITTGIFMQFEVPAIGDTTVESICNHSIQVGQAAKNVAKKLNLAPQVCEDAQLAGMLHDVGKLVELAYFRPQFKNAVSQARMAVKPLFMTEREELGVSHGPLGAYLLSLWGLPDTIVESAAFHHDPLRAGEADLGVLACVHIANAILRDMRVTSLACEGVGLDRGYLQSLDLLNSIDLLQKACVDQDAMAGSERS